MGRKGALRRRALYEALAILGLDRARNWLRWSRRDSIPGAGSQKLCSRGSQARDARGETKVVLKFALSTVHVATSNTAGVSQDGGEDSPP